MWQPAATMQLAIASLLFFESLEFLPCAWQQVNWRGYYQTSLNRTPLQDFWPTCLVVFSYMWQAERSQFYFVLTSALNDRAGCQSFRVMLLYYIILERGQVCYTVLENFNRKSQFTEISDVFHLDNWTIPNSITGAFEIHFDDVEG